MSNYAPTGNPINGARNISDQIRDEFVLIQNAISSKAERNSTNSVSSTSLDIGTGVKTLVIETGKELVGSQNVSIADAANPSANYMIGTLISYDSITGLAQVNVTAFSGSGTKTAWIVGLSNPAGVTLGSNTFTGAQNYARAIVASHATTADIWGAAGNQIDFTGTSTVTDFPVAPQAGASRELICAAACSFTAGVNMLIDGVSSGQTVTCSANDVMIVRAITVTQFRLTRIRYDGLLSNVLGNTKILRLNTGNDHGTVGNGQKIRRYSVIQTNTASDSLTYADSATLGGSITVVKSGYYRIKKRELGSGSSSGGVSKNASSLTTNYISLPIDQQLIHCKATGSTTIAEGISVEYLEVGEVIRSHDDNGGSGFTDANSGAYIELLRLF